MTVGAPRSSTVPEHPAWLTGLGLSTFVAMDLETTGLDPVKDEIIEIGAVRFVEGEPVGSFQSLIHTDRLLDGYVLNLTGIDPEELRHAPPFAQVSPALVNFLGGGPIVGVATDFHLSFLRASGEQSTVAADHFLFSHVPVLDAAMLARVFWPELPSFSLASLAGHFGIRTARINRAHDDAQTAGELAAEMIRRLPGRVWRDLACDLNRLIGSTTHRSRFFFAALAKLADSASRTSLAPAAEDHPVPCVPVPDTTGHLLGSNGSFATRLDFFEPRSVQLEMAAAVDAAFDRGEILLVEAPTGVGKSLAYLVPALRWALNDADGGRQVVISSHTKMLQEQLHRKDVRDVRRAIDQPFRSAVLKGRGNYLCKRRLKLLLREAGERLSELDRIQMMPLLRWSETTTTGDITEIGAFNPQSHSFLWAQVSSDALACAGSACSSAKGDFHRMAQERAAKAHLLFVNHALFFSDLARLTSGPADKRRFVLDESHQIERAAISALSVELSPLAFRTALALVAEERAARGLLPVLLRSHRDSLSGDAEQLATELLERARSLYLSVRQHFSLLGELLLARHGDSLRTPKIRFRDGDVWHRESVRAMGPFQLQWLEFSSRFSSLGELLGDGRGDDRLAPEMLVEFRSAADKLLQLGEKLERLLHDDDDNTVKWIEAGSTDHGAWCALYMSPVTVGGMMESAFWSSVGSAVLTSATLSAGGDFSLIRGSLGLVSDSERPAVELALDSPYDLARQMRIVVPTFLPDPRGNDPGFVAELGELISDVLQASRRATVVLCTSNDTVDRLSSALSPVAKRLRRPLFSQTRSASAPELLTEYRKHPAGILIGSATFWEGIDLVGDALEILIVSKIPFDVPTDPWVSARCDALHNKGLEPFGSFSVPAATLRMKQGIGRLIRHPNDRGVAILADPRLFTARYGQVIRQALPVTPKPAATREQLLEMVGGFFEDAPR